MVINTDDNEDPENLDNIDSIDDEAKNRSNTSKNKLESLLGNCSILFFLSPFIHLFLTRGKSHLEFWDTTFLPD